MGRGHHPSRRWIIKRAERGDLASVKEVAMLAGVPWQTAARWLREAKVDLALCRSRRLAKMYAFDRAAEIVAVGAQMSPQERRREMKQAVRRFNEAMAKDAGRAGEDGESHAPAE